MKRNANEITEQIAKLTEITVDLERKVDRLWDVVKRLNKDTDVFSEENINAMFLTAHEANDKLYAAVHNYINGNATYEEIKKAWDNYCEKLKRVAELVKEVINNEQE